MREVELLLNEPLPSYRTPRLRVLANGQLVTGAYASEITSNNHYSADHFSTVVALGADPYANADFWSSESDILIDIQLSLSGDTGFVSLLQGYVDTVSINPSGEVAHISGRDFTAALIEARTQEAFSNRTSSEIATIFASRHSLTPHVIQTYTPVGRFYQSDYEILTLSRFSKATTEWDFLVSLARHENYDVFVNGTNLYFQPSTGISSIDKVVYPTDLIELTLERALTLSRGIQVTVQSWNSLKQNSLTECVASTVSGDSSGSSGTSTRPNQQYVAIRPNLTPDKALAMARQCISEVSRHERVIELTMPGDLVLTPRSVIALDGTRTDFDQAYYIDSIERTFRPKTGFVQHIRAYNSSPRTETVLTSTVS